MPQIKEQNLNKEVDRKSIESYSEIRYDKKDLFKQRIQSPNKPNFEEFE